MPRRAPTRSSPPCRPAASPRSTSPSAATPCGRSTAQSRVLALNYNSGALIRELEFPQAAAGVAYDGEDLWLSVKNSSQLVLVNIVNGAQIRTLNLLRGRFRRPGLLRRALYVADRLTNAVLVVDPENGTIERSIPQPGFAIDGVMP